LVLKVIEKIIAFVIPILPILIFIISVIIQNVKEKRSHEHLLYSIPHTPVMDKTVNSDSDIYDSIPHTPVMDKTVNNDSDIYELLETCLKLGCNGFTMNETREMLNIEKVTNDNISKPKHYPTNCVNCGAVLHGNQCEYCGTEYN
jgi:hypothetical protein